jgi:hypothetical protein
MKHNSKTLFGLLLFLTTNLFGQDYDMLTKNEWMSTSSGFQKHYLFTFSEGKIKSEFIQSDWSKYIFDKGQIFIYNNDHVIYKKELDQIKEMGIQNATKSDTAIFQIVTLDKDSLVLEPKNLRARELSYYYNRRTFRLDSNSFDTNRTVKFYNRQLSYQKVNFDSLTLNYFDKSIIRIDSKGNYSIKKGAEGNKKKSKIQRLTSGQFDQLLELLYKSNINYFKTPDRFEWRTIKDYKGLKLKLVDKGESIKISTDYNDIPWTIKPIVDFMVALNKD